MNCTANFKEQIEISFWTLLSVLLCKLFSIPPREICLLTRYNASIEYYVSHSNDDCIIKLTVFALSIFEIVYKTATFYDAYSFLTLQYERSSRVNFFGISGRLLAYWPLVIWSNKRIVCLTIGTGRVNG